MNFNQLMIFLSYHKNILIGVSGIIEIAFVIAFMYYIFQLQKEGNKDKGERSKIISNVLFFGSCASILGMILVLLLSINPAKLI